MYYKLKVLILKVDINSEADKIITGYTQEWGKISAIVPGAKKIKAKLASATEPVMESEILVYLNSLKARPKVTGVKIIEQYSMLRKDWRRFVIAQCCSEIVDSLTPFNISNELKYNLLKRTWMLLGYVSNPSRIFLAFTLRFLKLSGYSFTEYLKREITKIPIREQNIILSLGTLSAEDVDKNLNIDPIIEGRISRYIENYLNSYLAKPLYCFDFLKSLIKSDGFFEIDNRIVV